MVTLAPIGVTTTHVPTIAVGPKRGFKGSLNSLEMDEASMGREFQVSPDALEAQRLEKLVRNLRRQVSTHDEDVRWVQLSHVDIIDWFTYERELLLAIKRDLCPQFKGPQKWASFISMYIHTLLGSGFLEH